MAAIRKVWIVGADGMVGKSFSRLLDQRSIKILKTDTDVDITDLEAINVYTDMYRPELIINCAGMTNLKDCEKNREAAYTINAVGARNLSVAARRVNAKLVQISTDDVFMGDTKEPYCEFDDVKPRSVYGKSKLAGENYVKEMAPKHIIIRSSWVYGDGNTNSFVNWVISEIQKGEDIYTTKTQIACPTSAMEVAKVIYRLIEHNEHGLYHACCTGSCSRFELAKKIVELMGSNVKVYEIESPSEEQLLRPSYSVLDNMMLRISKIEVPCPWEEALETYIKESTR